MVPTYVHSSQEIEDYWPLVEQYQMKEDEYRVAVIERMDVLIRLLLDGSPPAEKLSTASKIERLTGIGLAPAAVAKMIGKPVNYVTATMAQKRRSASPRKKQNA